MFENLPRLTDEWLDEDQTEYLTERLERISLENDCTGKLSSCNCLLPYFR